MYAHFYFTNCNHTKDLRAAETMFSMWFSTITSPTILS